MRTRRRAVLLVLVAVTLAASAASGAVRLPVISDMGRSIDPQGRLVQLNKFTVGSALTDGRFIWTVGAAGGTTRITDLSDGSVVQDIAPDAWTGGIAFSPDGRHAYLSSAGDHIRAFDVDPDSGTAAKSADIAVPPDRNAVPPIMPPDNLP